MPHLASDPRFLTNPLRVRNRVELLAIIRPVLRRAPASHWTPMLQRANVPCAPVQTIKQVFAHAQTHALDMVRFVPYPQPAASPSAAATAHSAAAGASALPSPPPLLPLIGPPVKFSAFSVPFRMPPPFLGQHTREVLVGVLGKSGDVVDGLCRDGVVLQHQGFA